MAVSEIQWRYFNNGNAISGFNDGNNTLYCGKNSGNNYVTEIAIKLDVPATSVTLSVKAAGLNGSASDRPLAYKMSPNITDGGLINAGYNTGRDGTFYIGGGTQGTASITIAQNMKAGQFYYIYIFDGSYYGVYNATILGGASTRGSSSDAATYSLSISAGEGSSITVNRYASQFAGTGNLGNGAVIYPQDQLQLWFAAQSGFEIVSATVNGAGFNSGATFGVIGNVSVATLARRLGVLYIDIGGQLIPHQCFIDDGNAFVPYLPYLDNGNSFELLA